MAKKKKKSGSIAVPFLITIFVGLLIIGGIAFWIYNHFNLGNNKELSEPTPRTVATATYEDSHTILLVLDEPDKKCSATFVLMRSVPKDKKLMFIGIPTNTIAVIDGRQQKLQSQYDRAGAAAAANFVQEVFDVPVDRYIKLNSEALIKLCDIFGGVTYPVNVGIAGFKSDGSNQYLNAEQIETLITYSMFPDGEIQRAYTASSIAADMMNQTDGRRIADNFDNNFSTIINMTESNITSVDYKNRKAAIKSMFERGTTIGSFLIVDGTVSYEDFIPSQNFIKDMKRDYFTDPED
ncbi:MAG: LCP family protein [Ruminococcus sp.]|nr:LCP family protein [Ruminococcus sp.]